MLPSSERRQRVSIKRRKTSEIPIGLKSLASLGLWRSRVAALAGAVRGGRRAAVRRGTGLRHRLRRSRQERIHCRCEGHRL